ncbi:MAG: ABC transporter ATP-binding protein/permease [Acidobacteriia bacterium]|nr:ABC transporter ATP-binding protein/permease [Terriglobia bacterium]
MAQFHEEEALGKAYDHRLMARLLRYVRPYWHMATVAMGCILVFAVLQAVPPYLTKVAIDRYILTHNYAGLGKIGLLFIAVLVASFVLEFFQTFLTQWMGQLIMYDMRVEIFTHLQKLQLKFFDKNPVGRLMTRVTTDVDALNELFAAGLVTVFGDLLTLLAILAVILRLNWRLALVSFAVIPFIVVTTTVFRRKARDSYRDVRAAVARISAFLQEHLSGMSVIQLFNREGKSFQQFETINERHRKANYDSILAYAVFFPIVEILSATAVALIIWYGGHEVLKSAIKMGTLVAFIQYSQRFFRPIQDLSEKYNILQSAMASSERIFKLLDTPVTIASPKTPHPLQTVQGSIEFRNVWFTYSDAADPAPEEYVLKDVSFRVDPGKSVAIVGHTGAGKTTLISLLQRFYDVNRGSILLDGMDLRELDLGELRRHYGVVLQDVFIFSGTFESNIRLGTPWIDEQQVQNAAVDVNLYDFIRELPNGLKEEVRERGSTLSVGQKQLMAFARALAHDPRILILDEATSSVDTETELKIREALARLMKGRTSIVIAHRLSTIQNADQIIVMHKGQVREIGNHQELLAKRGIYYRLYQLQYKEQETRVA